MKILRVGILAAMVLVASACASFQQHKSTAQLAVTYGTLKVIEKAGATEASQRSRAKRIAAVALEVKKFAAGSEVTVDLLQKLIVSKIPADMSPADEYLIRALVDEIVAELQRRTRQNLIGPEQLLAVEEIADWVISATKYAGA